MGYSDILNGHFQQVQVISRMVVFVCEKALMRKKATFRDNGLAFSCKQAKLCGNVWNEAFPNFTRQRGQAWVKALGWTSYGKHYLTTASLVF